MKITTGKLKAASSSKHGTKHQARPIPTLEELKLGRKRCESEEEGRRRRDLLKALRDGSGLDKFNKMTSSHKKRLSEILHKVDLSCCQLAGIQG